MSDRKLVFTYNYSNWPFDQRGDEAFALELAKITPGLQADLNAWVQMMHEAFDHETGFAEAELWTKALDEYHLLCIQLEDAGVKFDRDEWWNQKPKRA